MSLQLISPFFLSFPQGIRCSLAVVLALLSVIPSQTCHPERSEGPAVPLPLFSLFFLSFPQGICCCPCRCVCFAHSPASFFPGHDFTTCGKTPLQGRPGIYPRHKCSRISSGFSPCGVLFPIDCTCSPDIQQASGSHRPHLVSGKQADPAHENRSRAGPDREPIQPPLRKFVTLNSANVRHAAYAHDSRPTTTGQSPFPDLTFLETRIGDFTSIQNRPRREPRLPLLILRTSGVSRSASPLTVR